MNVAIFLENLIPEEGGGYTFEFEILEGLIKNCTKTDHKFFVFGWEKNTSLSSIKNSNIEYVSLYSKPINRFISKLFRIKNYYKKFLNPSLQIGRSNLNKYILAKLTSKNIDILWSITPMNLSTLDLPFITTVWDLQHRMQPYFPEVSLNGEWESRESKYLELLKRASYIFTGTNTGKSHIEKFYNIMPERIKVLPLPTPDFTLNLPSNDDKLIFDKYKIPKNYIFYPAQFWPHKNHKELILAVKYLNDNFNLNIPVVFVGSDKGNKSYIKELVDKYKLKDQVYFLNFVKKADIISLYKNAFALVYLSYFGPDNFPPLEAFALNCPVIASDIPGAREQLVDGAIFVDPSNKEVIAEAIKSLWSNLDIREKLIENGKIIAEKWTVNDYISAVFNILDDFETINQNWSNKNYYEFIP